MIEPLAPTVPITPPPSPAADNPPPLPRKAPAWSWIVGVFIPIAFFASWIGFSQNSDLFGSGIVGAFIGALVEILLIAALWPMIAAGIIGIPYMAVAVAGFGVPSPLGLLFSGFVWALVGRGLYALYHSRFKSVFWLIILAALVALGIGAYLGTADFREFDNATSSNPDACEEIGDLRNQCYNSAAIKSNDVSICEKITGYQRLTCIEDVVKPITYQDCVDIFGSNTAVSAEGNMIETYACLTRTAERTGNASLCNYPHLIDSGFVDGTQEVPDYFRAMCIKGSGNPEVPMTQ